MSGGGSEVDMVCVLRIGGADTNLESVKQVLPLEPYRSDTRGTDGAKANCLFYHVMSEDRSSSQAINSSLLDFLSKHGPGLEAVANLAEVDFRNLDIGLMLYEDRVAVSIELEEALIRKLSELSLSVSIATYAARPDC